MIDLLNRVDNLFIFGVCCYIQKNQFICAFDVVNLCLLHRVPGVADIDKLHALDHAAGIDVQAGNNAFGERHADRL